MLPGPDQIVACPRCEGLAKYQTLISGNTFGAVVWTDGRQIAPMMPHPPAVVKCAHCNECYWLRDAKEVGFDRSDRPGVRFEHGDQERPPVNLAPEEVELPDEPVGDLPDPPVDPGWRTARRAAEPTENEYYQAIDKGLASDRKQERELRILAWWRSNDPFREEPGEPPKRKAKTKTKAKAGASTSSSPARTKNLEALVGLLGGRAISDRVMKAEVMRELGQFEAAKQILGRITAKPWAGLVRQLQVLCDSRDTCVRVLEFGG